MTPSVNVTPAMTSEILSAPSNVRHRFWADCMSLKTIVRQAMRLPLPLVLRVRRRTVGDECRLDRVGGPDVLPVFSREVVERQQHIPVFR